MAKTKGTKYPAKSLAASKYKNSCAALAKIEIDKSVPTNEISAIVQSSAQWLNYAPVKTDDECLERLVDFFQYHADTGELPTIEKMILCLGVSKAAYYEWLQGAKGSGRVELLKKARDCLASIEAELALTGKIRDAVYIFRGKNYFGMRDQQDVVIQAKNPFENASREEIQRRLLEDSTEDMPTIETTATIVDVEE